MHKPHLLLTVLLTLILLLTVACNNAPETQVYIVSPRPPSGEPPETETASDANRPGRADGANTYAGVAGGPANNGRAADAPRHRNSGCRAGL